MGERCGVSSDARVASVYSPQLIIIIIIIHFISGSKAHKNTVSEKIEIDCTSIQIHIQNITVVIVINATLSVSSASSFPN